MCRLFLLWLLRWLRELLRRLLWRVLRWWLGRMLGRLLRVLNQLLRTRDLLRPRFLLPANSLPLPCSNADLLRTRLHRLQRWFADGRTNSGASPCPDSVTSACSKADGWWLSGSR